MVSPPTGVAGDLLQALVEYSWDAIALLDEHGIVRFESRSAERLLGYAPEERLNRSAFELVHADDTAAVAAAFARSAAEPGTPVTLEFRVRHKDGSWRHIEAVAVNRLAEPAVGGLVVNYRDLSKQKEAEDRLMEAVGQLTRGIAHDFNNVLAAILGCSDLMQLRLKPDDPLYLEAYEIGRAAERGALLTKQLLAFGRLSP
jgi:PAS domain S-box-containing protein